MCGQVKLFGREAIEILDQEFECIVGHLREFVVVDLEAVLVLVEFVGIRKQVIPKHVSDGVNLSKVGPEQRIGFDHTSAAPWLFVDPSLSFGIQAFEVFLQGELVCGQWHVRAVQVRQILQ